MAADLSPAALLLRSGSDKDYPISGDTISLGYEGSNDVRVALEGVSRQHAKITFDGNDYWIEDAGSSNGTFLNGIPVVRRERLRHLDVVTLGRRAELVFVRKAVASRRSRRRGILMAWLETVDGPEAGETREIPRGSITLGRAASSNVVVSSQLVSKAHARIERSGLELILTDLQSANGTFVEDKRIDSRVLKNGDEFSLGKARTYRVRVEEGEIERSEVGPSPGVESTAAGLPTDWKTRLEWTPEEKAIFERIRTEAAAKAEAAKPAPKAPPKAPPAARAEPRPKEEAAPKPEAATKPESAKPQPEGKERAETKPAAAPTAKAEPPARAEPESKPGAPAIPQPAEKPEPKPREEAAPKREPAVPPPAAPPEPPLARPAEPAPVPRLFLEGQTQTFALAVGTHEVGRIPATVIRLDGPQISRRHAVIRVTETEAILEDLGSSNGTFVNNRRITTPRTLVPGDLVAFGGVRFRVRFASGPGARRKEDGEE